MITKFLLGAALLCPLALMAQEKFDGKPGLWESTVVMEMAGTPAMPAMPTIDPDTLKNLPPAQRAQVEAMMKGRGGGGQRTSTNKFCMTKESFSKGFPAQDQRAQCTQKVKTMTAGKMEVHVDCQSGPTKTSGDMTVERVDAEHTKGTMVMKMNEPGNDRNVDMKMNFTSKWLSADCGDVKPGGEK